jgi:hypothetical protein
MPNLQITLLGTAETILEFVHGLRGSLHVGFEEGTYTQRVPQLGESGVFGVFLFY